MKRALGRRRGAGVLVLLLFAVFALCILLVLLLGSRSYRALVQRDEDSYHQRSAVQYLAAKVRHGDAVNALAAGSFSAEDPIPCLILRQSIEGEEFHTRIYCYNGYIRELFAPASIELEPGDGQEVLPASGLALTLEDGVLDAAVTDLQGRRSELHFVLRSGGEGVLP